MPHIPATKLWVHGNHWRDWVEKNGKGTQKTTQLAIRYIILEFAIFQPKAEKYFVHAFSLTMNKTCTTNSKSFYLTFVNMLNVFMITDSTTHNYIMHTNRRIP